MRIENVCANIIKVAGLNIAPGRQANVPDGAVPPGVRRLPDMLTEHQKLVRHIAFHVAGPIGLALTRQGWPRCDVLSRDMGRTVRAKQRDAAWREVQAKRA